jgi:CubicO group peptidase (beta-lactamase class C family)
MITTQISLNKACQNFIDYAMDYNDIPGLSIGVSIHTPSVKLGRTLTAGFKNYLTRESLEDGDIFHCVSISKLFTAAAIMKLERTGKLTSSSKLGNMINHTSGIGDITDYNWDRPRFDRDALRDYAQSDEVRRAVAMGEQKNFQSDFLYSNIAYDLLGLEIEKASGMSFEDYMKEEILEPCGMTDSTFYTPDWTDGEWDKEHLEKSRLVMPHTRSRDNRIVISEHYPYNRCHAPSSTLTSNPEDLMKWAEVVLREIEKNSAVSLDQLGWQTKTVDGHILYGHDGADDGFRGSFWLCPETGISVVLLANIDGAPTGPLSSKLYKAIRQG